MKSFTLPFVMLGAFLVSAGAGAQTLTETYTAGDIPTSYQSFDPACNGPNTTITIELPTGGPWEVTGFDVEYDMTSPSSSFGGFYQRSAIYSQNTGTQESTASGSFSSTVSYNRTNVNIANGYYPGEEELVFEMRAWRTSGASPDCGTNNNKVDDSTWMITVQYQAAPSCIPPQDIEITNLSPNQADVSWTQVGAANLWNIEYGESGFAQGSGTLVSGILSNPYSMTNLDLGTAYDVYVQADCGTDGVSAWAGPLNFTTPIISDAIEVSGFNADVVANGVGTMSSSTTNDVDGVNYCFVSEDWKLSAGDPNVNGGLPGDGSIESSAITGLNFQMSPFSDPYEGDNSLRIDGSGTGTLTLPTPANYQALYFLVTSGSGTSTVDVEVNFTDNTSETFTGISVPDWFQTGSIPVEIQGFGRGNLSNDNFEASGTNPKLFRITTDLDPANYTKAVSSVTFSNTGNVLNVFAISGKSGESCMTPSDLTIDDLTDVTVDISWSPNFTETDGYNWSLMAPGDDPDVDTPIDSGSTTTGVTDVSISGLTAETEYDFYVQTDCDTEESNWAGPFNFETLAICPPPTNLQEDLVTDTTADISWDASFNETNGYYWVLMAPGDDPDVDTPLDSGTTNTGDLDVSLSGLSLETEYDFYLRTDCGTDGESEWGGPLSFETTSLCPDPINVQLDDVDATSAEISWTASAAETDGYHWALMEPGDDPDVDTPVQNGTTATGAIDITLAGLLPQTSYDFYLMTDCGTDGESPWTAPLSITTTSVSYCTPSYSPTGSSWRISDFDVPEISFSHSQSGNTPTDHTSQILAVDAGSTYTFEITTIGWVGVGVAADFNYNGSFEDTDELLAAPTYIGNSPANYTYTVTIPTQIPTGNYRLRLWNVLANAGDGTPFHSPCGSYSYGTFADFTLSVTNPQIAGCQSPLIFNINEINNSTIEASWNASPDEDGGYNWALMYPGEHPDTDTPIDSGTTTSGTTDVTISNLDENTDYLVYVQTDCGTDGESYWMHTTFLIEGEGASCNNPIAITSLPYANSGDTGDYLNIYSEAPGADCNTSANYLNGYDVVYQYSPASNVVVSIELSDLSDFYAGVFVYEDCADIGNSCASGAINDASSNDFGISEIALSGGQDYYIVISSWLTTTVEYTLAITEVTCPEPGSPQVFDVLNTDAEASWDASLNEQNGYEWAVMNSGQHPDTDTPYDSGLTASSVTDATLTGLVPGDTYSFFVRADCDTDGMSNWVGPINFQTIDPAGDIPTSYSNFDANCNGPAYTIKYTLPSTGGPWEVTGIDIEYDMTAASGAYMSEQRSLIHFQNAGVDESGGPFSGSGTGGTYSYSRTNVDIANGNYPDGEELVFEMRAWRTWGGTDCGTNYNKVDAGSWDITVNYQPVPSCPPVTDLTVTSPADDEIEVSWTDIGPASSWNIEYGPAGFTQGTGTVVVATASPHLIDNLASGMEYDVYVQGDCGGGDLADWTGPVTIGVGIPTETYTGGDIPTSYQNFDASCNGPGTTLSISLPSSGGPWEVTSIDIEYDMTAASGAYMSEQRSLIHFQNNGVDEPGGPFSGTGLGGTYSYHRTNVDIANGYYPDGEELVFEMRAWRTWGGTDCGTNYNKVNDGTWTITVYYAEAPSCLPVQNIVAWATAPDEMDMEWDEIGTATVYNIEYGPVGFSPGTGTLITGVTSPHTITGLTPDMEYAVYVQGDCGGGDLAAWVGPVADSSGMYCEVAKNIWSLPYVNQGNTADYGNNYAGSPGTSCGGTNDYLNGDDVVYHFVPDEDMEIDILLTDIGGNNAGIFIYEDCADIGLICSDGAVNGSDTADLSIPGYEVLGGQGYYLLISTWAAPQSTGYTLYIDRVCASAPAIPTGDAQQGVCIGARLQDLDVSGSDIRWYASETDIVPLPVTTELTDGQTYYASQVVDHCESERLAVTVTLLEKSALPEGSTNQEFYEGETLADLDVQGDDLRWYQDGGGDG